MIVEYRNFLNKDDATICKCRLEAEKEIAIIPSYVINSLKERGLVITLFTGQLTQNKELKEFSKTNPRGWGGRYTYNKVRGCYYPQEKRVFIGLCGDYYDDYCGEDVLLHEIGHAFDYLIGYKFYRRPLSGLKIVHSMTINEPFSDNNYFNKHADEYIANSFMMFYKKRDELKSKHPTIYNFINNIEDRLL